MLCVKGYYLLFDKSFADSVKKKILTKKLQFSYEKRDGEPTLLEVQNKQNTPLHTGVCVPDVG